ncbi:hypothetical protein IAQ61_003118 [Plenodomus lingam]|uniref:uncharacterized protein n=1 Tax=Leptosphaeria maculans TaxID=5022 RepID=UPI00332C44FE|nr:hypothetical protein IAQ61_003118 [Plenodomus lingam]
MTYDTMQKVLRPKVQGSINLDALLGDTALDFFVFFSSATAIIGNVGQSNYSAANMFMTSLARQRRQRGLAASVMHIGPILGVGYVSQKGEEVRDIFARQGEYTFMSEQDFHQLFAEAVMAGRPGSKLPLEITMGISKVNTNPAKTLAWYSDPMAAHMIGSATAETASKTSESRASVKALLAKAKSRGEATEVLKNVFLPVIGSLFQMDTAAIQSPDSHFLDTRLDEFGLDSLLAVEIRTWWLKTLQVNMPVMRILSGITVRELIVSGVDDLPSELIPNMRGSIAENGNHSSTITAVKLNGGPTVNGTAHLSNGS